MSNSMTRLAELLARHGFSAATVEPRGRGYELSFAENALVAAPVQRHIAFMQALGQDWVLIGRSATTTRTIILTVIERFPHPPPQPYGWLTCHRCGERHDVARMQIVVHCACGAAIDCATETVAIYTYESVPELRRGVRVGVHVRDITGTLCGADGLVVSLTEVDVATRKPNCPDCERILRDRSPMPRARHQRVAVAIQNEEDVP